MAKRKKKTTKAVARDNVTLNSVFTDIANAIRAKAETSDPIYPRNMGNAIRGINGVTEASLPEANLPAVFQDIADAIRACGITGTMTATQMAGKIGDIVPKQKTRVTYTQASGLPDWEDVITGEIAGTSTSPYYTSQIPNAGDIETVQIGEDVTSIGSYAFRECVNLTSIVIPNNVTSFGISAFYGCTSLSTINIPEGVTSLPNNLFSSCSNLTNIVIPQNCTSFGRASFRNCTSLSGINIPEGLQSIGMQLFYQCTGMQRFTLPSTITGISASAFSGCSNCSIFDFRRLNAVPTLSAISAFENTPSDKEIIVPDALYDDWIVSNNWSSTDNNIVNCIVKASQSSLGTL